MRAEKVWLALLQREEIPGRIPELLNSPPSSMAALILAEPREVLHSRQHLQCMAWQLAPRGGLPPARLRLASAVC